MFLTLKPSTEPSEVWELPGSPGLLISALSINVESRSGVPKHSLSVSYFWPQS